jgi:hypothetical protein
MWVVEVGFRGDGDPKKINAIDPRYDGFSIVRNDGEYVARLDISGCSVGEVMNSLHHWIVDMRGFGFDVISIFTYEVEDDT